MPDELNLQSVKEYEESGDVIPREDVCMCCVVKDIDKYFKEYRQCCLALCNATELQRRKEEHICRLQTAIHDVDQRAHRAELERKRCLPL